MSTVPCPSCKTMLQLPPSAAGKQVRCPKCQHIFMVPAQAEEPIYEVPAAPPPAPLAPTLPPRSDDPWDDDRDDRRDEPRRRNRDDDDSPPRRRRNYDDDDAGDSSATRRVRRYEYARSALSGPAIGLIISGALGLICPLLMIVPIVAEPRNNREPGLVAVTVITIGVHYVWSICLLVGANAMRTASNKGLIIFGCVISFLPCNCLWLLAMPMGIWALVVFNSPDVSENIR